MSVATVPGSSSNSKDGYLKPFLIRLCYIRVYCTGFTTLSLNSDVKWSDQIESVLVLRLSASPLPRLLPPIASYFNNLIIDPVPHISPGNRVKFATTLGMALLAFSPPRGAPVPGFPVLAANYLWHIFNYIQPYISEQLSSCAGASSS